MYMLGLHVWMVIATNAKRNLLSFYSNLPLGWLFSLLLLYSWRLFSLIVNHPYIASETFMSVYVFPPPKWIRRFLPINQVLLSTFLLYTSNLSAYWCMSGFAHLCHHYNHNFCSLQVFSILYFSLRVYCAILRYFKFLWYQRNVRKMNTIG